MEVAHPRFCSCCQCGKQQCIILACGCKRPCSVGKFLHLEVAHVPLCSCLGISPPSLKDKESKESNEREQLQDLKPKHIKKNFEKVQKMIPRTYQKEGKISENRPSEASWNPLGSLLEPLGRLLGPSWKKHKKNTSFGPQLGSQNGGQNRKKSMSK